MVLTFTTLMLVNLLATWIGRPSPVVNHGMLTRMQELTWGRELAVIVVNAIILGPVLEELVFRGLLQTWLLHCGGRRARWAVIVFASAIFASVHLGATTWHALPGLFVLGLTLGWLYERTGSLLSPILVHAGFNTLNIAMVLYASPPAA